MAETSGVFRIDSMAEATRSHYKSGAPGPCPLEATDPAYGGEPLNTEPGPTFGGFLADLECEHGNVPATPDAVSECFCFRKAPTPDLMDALKKGERAADKLSKSL